MFSVLISLLITVGNPYQLFDHVSFTHEGEVIEDVHREDYSIPYLEDTLVQGDSFTKLEEKMKDVVFREPTNAIINEYNEIVPGVSGKQLDSKRFREQFYTTFYQGGPNKIELPIKHKYPSVDSELLDMIRTNKIGYYVTYFNTNNTERTTNINLSVEAINNHVVFPNEVFSFNDVVGMRTEEKGYLPAPVIVKGELAEDIGGGICQVSSTLYNAVYRAGIKVLERYSHSRKVPYVPPGRDATVSWYGPDFTFQNSYNQPILIRAKTQNGTVSISIFTADEVQANHNKVPKASDHLPEEIEMENVN